MKLKEKLAARKRLNQIRREEQVKALLDDKIYRLKVIDNLSLCVTILFALSIFAFIILIFGASILECLKV